MLEVVVVQVGVFPFFGYVEECRFGRFDDRHPRARSKPGEVGRVYRGALQRLCGLEEPAGRVLPPLVDEVGARIREDAFRRGLEGGKVGVSLGRLSAGVHTKAGLRPARLPPLHVGDQRVVERAGRHCSLDHAHEMDDVEFHTRDRADGADEDSFASPTDVADGRGQRVFEGELEPFEGRRPAKRVQRPDLPEYLRHLFTGVLSGLTNIQVAVQEVPRPTSELHPGGAVRRQPQPAIELGHELRERPCSGCFGKYSPGSGFGDVLKLERAPGLPLRFGFVDPQPPLPLVESLDDIGAA